MLIDPRPPLFFSSQSPNKTSQSSPIGQTGRKPESELTGGEIPCLREVLLYLRRLSPTLVISIPKHSNHTLILRIMRPEKPGLPNRPTLPLLLRPDQEHQLPIIPQSHPNWIPILTRLPNIHTQLLNLPHPLQSLLIPSKHQHSKLHPTLQRPIHLLLNLLKPAKRLSRNTNLPRRIPNNPDSPKLHLLQTTQRLQQILRLNTQPLLPILRLQQRQQPRRTRTHQLQTLRQLLPLTFLKPRQEHTRPRQRQTSTNHLYLHPAQKVRTCKALDEGEILLPNRTIHSLLLHLRKLRTAHSPLQLLDEFFRRGNGLLNRPYIHDILRLSFLTQIHLVPSSATIS